MEGSPGRNKVLYEHVGYRAEDLTGPHNAMEHVRGAAEQVAGFELAHAQPRHPDRFIGLDYAGSGEVPACTSKWRTLKLVQKPKTCTWKTLALPVRVTKSASGTWKVVLRRNTSARCTWNEVGRPHATRQTKWRVLKKVGGHR